MTNYDRLAITKEVHTIDIADIHIKEGLNQRIDYGDIEQLAWSIFEHGVLEPIKYYLESCTEGGFERKGKRWKIIVTEGHRRMASIAWGKENIPGFKEKITTIQGINSGKYTNEEDWLTQQIILNEKKAFTPLEKAKVFKRLIDLGWTEHKISKKFGVGFAMVQNALVLASAPTQVQQLVEQNKITANAITTTLEEVKEEVGYSSEKILEVYQDAIQEVEESGSKGRANPKNVVNALNKRSTRRNSKDIPLHEKSDKAIIDMLFTTSHTTVLDNGFTNIVLPTILWEEVLRRIQR